VFTTRINCGGRWSEAESPPAMVCRTHRDVAVRPGGLMNRIARDRGVQPGLLDNGSCLPGLHAKTSTTVTWAWPRSQFCRGSAPQKRRLYCEDVFPDEEY
jgi:hypothetical protein